MCCWPAVIESLQNCKSQFLREGEKIKDLCSEHIVLPKPKWETILQLMTYLIKRKENYQKELYSVVIIIFFTASFKLAWFS